jgi:hypothetical protein
VAIYHLNVKTISRSAGRTATAAAAYRAGVEIEDKRTGEVHDYTRRRGVETAELFLPDDAPAWAHDRAELWNRAEQAETRKNSTVAREIVVALPAELDQHRRADLARSLAAGLVERHGCAVDLAIHAPGAKGDDRNHHAHLLMTTRRLEPEGFTAKTRELDQAKNQEVPHWRARWADLANDALERAGRSERIDHRSLQAQGIEREPTRHLGPGATAAERETGEPSRRRLDFDARVSHRTLAQVQAADRSDQAGRVDAQIIDLEQRRAALLEQRQAPTLEAPTVEQTTAPAEAPALEVQRAKLREARQQEKREQVAAIMAGIEQPKAPAPIRDQAPAKDQASAETPAGRGRRRDFGKVPGQAPEAPAPERKPIKQQIEERRERERAERERKILDRTEDGKAGVTLSVHRGLLHDSRLGRTQRTGNKLFSQQEATAARRREHAKAAPSKALRFVGRYAEARASWERDGAALDRRAADLARRRGIVGREGRPERVQQWADKKTKEQVPKLIERAAVEREAKRAVIVERDRERELEKEGPSRGGSGRGKEREGRSR